MTQPITNIRKHSSEISKLNSLKHVDDKDVVSIKRRKKQEELDRLAYETADRDAWGTYE